MANEVFKEEREGLRQVQALSVVQGLEIPSHDYILMTYDDSGNLTQVVYKKGGSTGTIVATLTLSYDVNNNLISVSKS